MFHFVKSHGLGNDYIVIDPARIPVELTPDAVRLICHRNYGVGSDGILALSAPMTAPMTRSVKSSAPSSRRKVGRRVGMDQPFVLA